jgi:hypothetical protein
MTAILRWSRRSRRTNSARRGLTGRTSTISTPARAAFDRFAAEKGTAAERIHQRATETPRLRHDQRRHQVIDEAAGAPDVELHVHRRAGGVDVGNQRAHDRLAVGEQLQAMAAHQRQAGDPVASRLILSLRWRGWLAQPRLSPGCAGPAQNLRLQGNRPLHPGPAETALADQQIRQGADGRHENDQQQPRQRRAVRTSPRKDAQRNRQASAR